MKLELVHTSFIVKKSNVPGPEFTAEQIRLFQAPDGEVVSLMANYSHAETFAEAVSIIESWEANDPAYGEN